MNAWLPMLFVLTAIAMFWLGYRQGKRAGLRAPLDTRYRVLSAEVRRAENALGLVLPRKRSASFNRHTSPRGSK